MNKILGFFRKAETIYLRILWGILLYLVVCMLLNYSDCPSALVVLIKSQGCLQLWEALVWA